MRSKNVLLRSKAVRLTVARLGIMRLARGAGPLLVTADLVVNLIAGALPVVFTIAAAVAVGRVPAAVRGGLHSSAWSTLLRVADDSAVLVGARMRPRRSWCSATGASRNSATMTRILKWRPIRGTVCAAGQGIYLSSDL
jgi:hypothetical protein